MHTITYILHLRLAYRVSYPHASCTNQHLKPS